MITMMILQISVQDFALYLTLLAALATVGVFLIRFILLINQIRVNSARLVEIQKSIDSIERKVGYLWNWNKEKGLRGREEEVREANNDDNKED